MHLTERTTLMELGKKNNKTKMLAKVAEWSLLWSGQRWSGKEARYILLERCNL